MFSLLCFPVFLSVYNFDIFQSKTHTQKPLKILSFLSLTNVRNPPRLFGEKTFTKAAPLEVKRKSRPNGAIITQGAALESFICIL